MQSKVQALKIMISSVCFLGFVHVIRKFGCNIWDDQTTGFQINKPLGQRNSFRGISKGDQMILHGQFTL